MTESRENTMPVTDEQLSQVIAPLVKSIDRFEAHQDKFDEKLDQLPNLYVTRQEWNSNNATQMSLISAVSSQVSQLASQVERNRDKVEQTQSDGGKWFLDKFDAVEQRINIKLDAQTKAAEDQFSTYKRDQGKGRQWVYGLIYSTVSATVVGIIIVAIQHFFLH